MRLKLRANRNKAREKVWSLYQIFGKREKLYKRLGPIPKELAETILKKEMVRTLCHEENIRQNADVSFDQACDEYLTYKCQPPHKSEGTYYQNKWGVKQIKRVMGKVFDRARPYHPNKVFWVYEITLSMLDSYKILRKEEGVSNRTINIELNLIRCILKYAMEANYLVRFPFEKFKNLQEEQTKRVWCENVSDVERMIHSAYTPSTALKLRLGFEAGLRSAEILKLRLDGIDLEHRVFHVYGEKEDRFKEIPMSQEMADLLRPLMTHRYNAGNGKYLKPREPHQMTYLFCDEAGKPFQSFKKSFARARDRSGVGIKITPHGMRHTFASHLLQAEANPVDVSRMLGHKKVSTTVDIYGHSSRSGRQKAFDKLPYIRRDAGAVIPFRQAVNDGFFAKVGSKSIEVIEAEIANLLKNKERPAGFEPATLSFVG